ncbi:hypothetical protein [Curtobacterium sp. SL109]|uniref:hypothetical protein n=1 Tax=Curtobacterium sp. SL109 TaxID=2994662 RepID=UPI002276D8C0|nr:hypothetical protein [Curtobacterium sp. SL109]MCY1696267.1 hypothetical protein [Curtobacterium sp. SL109]
MTDPDGPQSAFDDVLDPRRRPSVVSGPGSASAEPATAGVNVTSASVGWSAASASRQRSP